MTNDEILEMVKKNNSSNQKTNIERLTEHQQQIKEKKEQEMVQKSKKDKQEIKEEQVSDVYAIYEELLSEHLFEDLFDLFKDNVQKIGKEGQSRAEVNLEKRKYIKGFFNVIFSLEAFDTIVDEEQLNSFVKIFLEDLKSDFYKENGISEKLNSFIDPVVLSAYFAESVLQNKFDHADMILPFIDNELARFVNTIDNVQTSNNVEALRYLCKNMKNIHFSEGDLLRSSLIMRPEALKMLIDEFKFDPNEGNVDGLNLIHGLVTDRQPKNFSYIINRYHPKINLSQPVQIKIDKHNSFSGGIFDFIKESPSKFDFINTLLSVQNAEFLKQSHVEKIGEIIFDNEFVQSYAQTDLYEKFFSHPSFDPQIFNLNQCYFIYGLISRIGTIATDEDSKDSETKNYVRILDAYLDNMTSDDVPPAPLVHVVGAAIQVAISSDQNSVVDACTMIIKKFKQYINKPNPSGVLPIAQVEKDSNLYRILLNNGAIPLEPEVGFFASAFSFLRKKGPQPALPTQNIEDVSSSNTHTLSSLRVKMRDDFRVMRTFLNNPNMDLEIKVTCENMFMKADKIGRVLERNNINTFSDEIHFLNQNFSRYLKKSLESYNSLLSNFDDFDSPAFKEQLEKGKQLCFNHVKTLDNQIDMIEKNVSASLSDSALSDLRVRERFLAQKVAESGFSNVTEIHETGNLEEEQVSQQTPQKEDNVISVFRKNKM